ncbi:MAG TPA: hypothetical protein VMY41_17985 [Thermohalobaculum sp.]|nr:hypothetical protein [Thermohalobaculum sp.]
MNAIADAFSASEWTKIHKLLAKDEARFGLPQRRDGSFVLASFNIRKCGDPTSRSDGALDLMTSFIRRCDLVAVQEVVSDLSMIEALRDRAAADGSTWELAVSDVTGGVTGGQGMEERLAFLYRPARFARGPVLAISPMIARRCWEACSGIVASSWRRWRNTPMTRSRIFPQRSPG